MEYKIEHDVPFPAERVRNSGRPKSYPFDAMGVGDSFFVPSNKKYFSQDRALSAAMHRARVSSGRNFVPVREAGGFRIFRCEGEVAPRKYEKKT